jgi:uncharacterized protein (DUF427 family)
LRKSTGARWQARERRDESPRPRSPHHHRAARDENPFAAVGEIAGHLAFYAKRVDAIEDQA